MSATTQAANDPAMPKLFLPGETLGAGAGVSWVSEGWDLFKKSPVMWIVMFLVVAVIAVVLAFIPFLGQLAFQIITPVIAGGFVMACWSVENGGELEFEHLFAGFKRNFKSLAIVGVIYLVASLVIMVIMFLPVGLSIIPVLFTAGGDADAAAIALGTMGVGFAISALIALGLGVMLAAAYWFAPALVIMHGLSPIDAMKASFFASFRNFIPFLVYGIVLCLLLIPVMLTLGLGILVWVPVAIASSYRAYRQIFTEE
ncbi:BPSS1780 family membrane protein [Usitatibacter palustris]|uniref:DUF2189 domain-containing protein n=1 Tax=Usitatibacter palustris TaxID=2732487 RepID=A0A6M4HDE9_9PROT|nr:BPSS1780 family membrane protein [Usitatibacter palustris]QJR16604.1 hypothetical protein DSM104440_03439 [Usitatibacter palustris]